MKIVFVQYGEIVRVVRISINQGMDYIFITSII